MSKFYDNALEDSRSVNNMTNQTQPQIAGSNGLGSSADAKLNEYRRIAREAAALTDAEIEELPGERDFDALALSDAGHHVTPGRY